MLQGLQTGSPAAAENVQPAQETTLATLNCSLSAKKMHLELIEAYVRWLGKPVSRRRRCTESFTRTWNFCALRGKGHRNWPKQTKLSCSHTAAAEKVSRAQTLTDVNVYELLRRLFEIGNFCFWVPFFKQLLLRNCAGDFVEICNVCARKVIIKVAKRMFNSNKIWCSYCDFYFGVTFFWNTVYISQSVCWKSWCHVGQFTVIQPAC